MSIWLLLVLVCGGFFLGNLRLYRSGCRGTLPNVIVFGTVTALSGFMLLREIMSHIH